MVDILNEYNEKLMHVLLRMTDLNVRTARQSMENFQDLCRALSDSTTPEQAVESLLSLSNGRMQEGSYYVDALQRIITDFYQK